MSYTVESKPFPYGYSQNVVDIIKIITFSKGNPEYFQIFGSAGISSQMYYGDYDIFEVVTEDIYKKKMDKNEYIDALAKQFQQIIRKLLSIKLLYIGDIKCGEISEWNITDTNELKKLYDEHIIDKEEYDLALDEINCITCKKSRRFGVIRWKPIEILKGYKILRDGRKYTLQDGIKSENGITKLDIITYVHCKFTEMSIIYKFKYNNKSLGVTTIDILNDIYEDIMINYLQDKFFKVLKRLFTISKLNHDKKELILLTNILNSDLGRLYSVISDINTILFILENYKNIPKVRLRDEIQEFRTRLSNIYTLNQWMKIENYVLKHIANLQFIKSKTELYDKLKEIQEILNLILSYYSLIFLIENKKCIYKCDTDEKIDITNHQYRIRDIMRKLDVLKNKL